MSEATIAAAVGAAEQVLAPEAEAALKDAHALVTAEADKLRQSLPGLTEAAIAHVRSVAEEVLTGYHNVLAHLEAKLGIAVPTLVATADPAPAPAPAEHAPDVVVAVDPTLAPSTTEASSAPSSTPSTSDTTPAPEAPAAPQA